MNVYLDFLTLLDVFCIVQGLTTAIWLFLKRNQPANWWLAWLIVGFTLQVIDYFLSRSGVYFQHRQLYFTPLFFSWSFGPLFYNYVLAQLGKSERVHRYWFVPVVVQTVFYLGLMVQSLPTKAWFWQVVHKPYTRFIDYYGGCGLLLYFLVRSGLTIWQSRRSGSEAYAVENRWLAWFTAGLTLFCVMALIDPLVNFLYLPPKAPRFYIITFVLPLFVYALALIGLFRDRFRKNPKPLSGTVVTDHQQERVRLAMTVDKLYRDPDLTLASLAQHLTLTPNAVSRIINAGFNQSFADFVNAYRVQDVKQRLATGQADRFTILALGLDAGFSSKTTFNRVFKEQTGFTPKEYEKKSQITLRDDT